MPSSFPAAPQTLSASIDLAYGMQPEYMYDHNGLISDGEKPEVAWEILCSAVRWYWLVYMKMQSYVVQMPLCIEIGNAVSSKVWL